MLQLLWSVLEASTNIKFDGDMSRSLDLSRSDISTVKDQNFKKNFHFVFTYVTLWCHHQTLYSCLPSIYTPQYWNTKIVTYLNGEVEFCKILIFSLLNHRCNKGGMDVLISVGDFNYLFPSRIFLIYCIQID